MVCNVSGSRGATEIRCILGSEDRKFCHNMCQSILPCNNRCCSSICHNGIDGKLVFQPVIVFEHYQFHYLICNIE